MLLQLFSGTSSLEQESVEKNHRKLKEKRKNKNKTKKVKIVDSYEDEDGLKEENSSESLTNETRSNNKLPPKSILRNKQQPSYQQAKGRSGHNNLDDENEVDEDQLSDDEFLKRIEGKGDSKGDKNDKSEKKEEPKVDLDKLTKRQRMAYLQKQNPLPNKQQQISIGRLSKQDQTAALARYLDPNADGDMVFYELSNAKKYDEFDYDEDDELNPGLPRNRVGRKPKTQANQQQIDEQKRQQLEKILEEQKKKFKDREKKLTNHMNSEVSGGNGVVGRYIFQNSQRIQAKICPTKPGQCNIKVKLIYKKDKPTKLLIPKELIKNDQKYGGLICKQSNAGLIRRIEDRQRSLKCFCCGKTERKYVCSVTKRIACSFECYQKNKVKV
ncbi:UNKNOWN [Stylonychia lemnae]|uniref:Uncharacterized protein n=1 Tax=Stylonychia lemnae TaxID=5949 RepID=A0A077ZX15_STYLE|nr:UNKNOWN [Stylonychia lemnae]|eukprot:CDW73056.1 UNKNOWN [Stylonychia lemnae]